MILGMENSADILVRIAGKFCFASDFLFFIQLHEKQKGSGGGGGVKMEHAGNSYGLMDISVAREAWWH
jgi:hypothetical protein